MKRIFGGNDDMDFNQILCEIMDATLKIRSNMLNLRKIILAASNISFGYHSPRQIRIRIHASYFDSL